MRKITLLSTALFTALALPLQGIVLNLDFTTSATTYRSLEQSLVINYSNVSTGVGAPSLDIRIRSIEPYIPHSASAGNNQNGSVDDDLKMHIDSGGSTRFRFSLFEAGTTTLYDPGEDFSFSFVIYDLDGSVTSSRGASQVTFYDTPLTYTLTSTTTISKTQDQESITFTGTAGSVDGNEGITSFSTTDQENAAVGITIENTNRFEFAISAPHNGIDDGGRSILFDPTDLTVTGTPVDYVPEPGSFALWAGIAAVGAVFRRRR